MGLPMRKFCPIREDFYFGFRLNLENFVDGIRRDLLFANFERKWIVRTPLFNGDSEGALQPARGGRGKDAIMAVTRGGAGAGDKNATLFDKGVEAIRKAFIHEYESRKEDKVQPFKGVGGIDEAAGDATRLELPQEMLPLVPGIREAEGHRVVSLVLVDLDENGGAHERDGTQNFGAESPKLLAFLGELLVAPSRDVVVVEDAVPVNLSAKATGAPAEVENAIGSMGHGLPGPKPHLAWARRGVDVRPLATRSALLFEDDIVAGSGPAFLVLDRSPDGIDFVLIVGIGGESRIDINTVEVEVPGEGPMVDMIEGTVV